MASIKRREDGQWRARYRDDAGREHARHFARKVDAQRWIDETTAAVVTGQYVDPKAGKTTVRQYAVAWQSAQVTREHSTRNTDVALRLHVLPHIGDRPLGSVRPSDMQALVKTLTATLAPGTVRETYKVAGRMFAAAVDDRILAASPCHRIRLPRDDRPEVVPPTVEQITALAGAVSPRYRALVVLLAGSGLRIGEALGLNITDVDFLRRTVKVERQRLPSGRIGPPKTLKSARTVPLGQVVIDELAGHLSAYPSDGPLFTLAAGRPLVYRTWRDIWASAGEAESKAREDAAAKVRPHVDTIPLDVDTHALRHFYASALIAGGASVKVVQTRLGHASAVTTLNTYGHLWPGDDDLTRTVMDAAFGLLADSLRTSVASEG
jgi:integrase